MSLITLDFETFYSKDYSLSKMTTEEYIRGDQFEVIGFAYRIDDQDPVWVSGEGQCKVVLQSLHLENHTVLCHNMAFDGAILSFRYGIHPKMLVDTMGLAQPITAATVGGSLAALAKKFALGEKGTEVVNALGKHLKDFTAEELRKYGEYCINDVVLTYNLYHVLKQYSNPTELYVMDLLLRMYTDPLVFLDKDILQAHLESVLQKKAALMEQIDTTIGRENLMSNPKFAQLLIDHGVEPPTKTSPATGKETFAFSKTDVEFKALLEHENEDVQSLVAARLGVKSTLEETRTIAFLKILKRGNLPIMLKYYGAHTGRCSGGDGINLQNLPRGGALRYALKTIPGHSFVAADSSQIEARIVGWVAGERELVSAFAAGEDIYSKFASSIYGREVTKENDKTARHVGKTAILGLGFGMGKDKFRSTLKTSKPSVDISLEESERVVAVYRAKYDKIKALWKQGDEAIKAMASGNSYTLGIGIKLLCDHEGVHLPNGMKLKYNNLSWRLADGVKRKKDGFYYDTRYGETSLYSGKIIENIVQALARIVVFVQMCMIDQKLRRVDKRATGTRFKTVLTVHDEVVVVCPDKAVEKVTTMMESVMKITPKWAKGLPITCESASGKSYGDCK